MTGPGRPALPRGDRRLVLEAAAWLALAMAALALIPFRRVAARFGALGVVPPAPGPDGEAAARRIGRAVERAARRLPGRPACLPCAIAAQAMLRRRGIPSTLHFGTLRAAPGEPGPSLRAHAWLTVGGTGVVGQAGSAGFTEIARFGDPGPRG